MSPFVYACLVRIFCIAKTTDFPLEFKLRIRYIFSQRPKKPTIILIAIGPNALLINTLGLNLELHLNDVSIIFPSNKYFNRIIIDAICSKCFYWWLTAGVRNLRITTNMQCNGHENMFWNVFSHDSLFLRCSFFGLIVFAFEEYEPKFCRIDCGFFYFLSTLIHSPNSSEISSWPLRCFVICLESILLVWAKERTLMNRHSSQFAKMIYSISSGKYKFIHTIVSRAYEFQIVLASFPLLAHL